MRILLLLLFVCTPLSISSVALSPPPSSPSSPSSSEQLSPSLPPALKQLKVHYEVICLLARVRDINVLVFWNYLSHRSKQIKIHQYHRFLDLLKEVSAQITNLIQYVKRSKLSEEKRKLICFTLGLIRIKVTELQAKIAIFINRVNDSKDDGQQIELKEETSVPLPTTPTLALPFPTLKSKTSLTFASEIVAVFLSMLEIIMGLLDICIKAQYCAPALKTKAIAEIKIQMDKLLEVKSNLHKSKKLKKKQCKILGDMLETKLKWGSLQCEKIEQLQITSKVVMRRKIPKYFAALFAR